MTFIEPIPEMVIVGVFDRGVPSKERIVFRVTTQVETSQFGVLIGIHQESPNPPVPMAFPVNDYFYWFGQATVEAGEWIFLYTGSGSARRTTLEGTGDVAYVLHWNKPTTLFANSLVTPLLVRFGGLLVGAQPVNRLQLALSQKRPVNT